MQQAACALQALLAVDVSWDLAHYKKVRCDQADQAAASPRPDQLLKLSSLSLRRKQLRDTCFVSHLSPIELHTILSVEIDPSHLALRTISAPNLQEGV